MKANLVVVRRERTKVSTIGELSINGKFFCYTIEDFDRDANKDGDIDDAGEAKVFGETAIPSGTYKVIVSLSQRFKRDLPLLVGVKGFDGIRIHKGNYAKDSHGCLIVGYKKDKDAVRESTKCEADLVAELKKYTEIFIEIK